MRNIRAVFVPILVLAALMALAWLEVQLAAVARFDFIWDVLLGCVLGMALALLPGLAGFAQKKNVMTSMLWVCAFLALLLVFFQYMTLVTGMRVEGLSFLTTPGTRMRVVEGAVLGHCTVIAARGKL